MRQKCKECGSHDLKSGVHGFARYWRCQECGTIHVVTFGGEWATRSDEWLERQASVLHSDK